MMQLIQQLTATSTESTALDTWQPAARSPDNSYHSDEESDHQDYDTMSTQTIETDNHSSMAASPVKKKTNANHVTPLSTPSAKISTPLPSDQDKSAQYTNPRTPDDGET
ncbi:hypothetical protein MHU86_15084 [Fragilaria crotonensis]|nr:hypothetical protein MHU86_15084 [Fragilaria crotonensis]